MWRSMRNDLGKNESISSNRGVKLRLFPSESRPFDASSDRLESYGYHNKDKVERSKRISESGSRNGDDISYKNQISLSRWTSLFSVKNSRSAFLVSFACIDYFVFSCFCDALPCNYHVNYNFGNRFLCLSDTRKLHR